MFLNKKLTCSSLTFVMLATAFYTFVLNIAFYKKAYLSLGMETISDYVLLGSFFIFIFCFINVLFSIILVGFLKKPLLIILLLISSAASYFSYFYGIYIDEDMITNVIQTNMGESVSLITPKLILWVIVFGVLPSLLVIFCVEFKTNTYLRAISWRLINIIISIAIIVAIYFLRIAGYTFYIKTYKDTIKLITPTNYINGIVRNIQEYYKTEEPFVHIGEDAKRIPTPANQKKKLLIVVVGETSRAKNFSLNGYSRETNPLLKKQQVINFLHASSCGTATAISVPCMFSNLGQENYDGSTANRQDNLLDILQRTGINIFWKENDGGCKGVCDRVPNQDISLTEPKDKCFLGLCYDIMLLKGLEHYINTRKDDTVIVLHTNGSHGPAYYQRYQAAQQLFTPACEQNQVDDCPKDQLINAYDNTIVNVDYVLNAIIELLKKHHQQFSTAMIYMSDHGESLGENGFYLHGAPYNIAPSEQTHIPMIFWLSDNIMTDNKINKNCLELVAKYNKKVSHDNLFHTVLGAMKVATKEYNPKLDLLRMCEAPS